MSGIESPSLAAKVCRNLKVSVGLEATVSGLPDVQLNSPEIELSDMDEEVIYKSYFSKKKKISVNYPQFYSLPSFGHMCYLFFLSFFFNIAM